MQCIGMSCKQNVPSQVILYLRQSLENHFNEHFLRIRETLCFYLLYECLFLEMIEGKIIIKSLCF